MEFYVTTPKGMSELLRDELEVISSECKTPAKIGKPEIAGVSASGDLEFAYRVCLYSRIANRVLLPLKKFHCPTPEKLYAGAKSIKWSDHMGVHDTLAVDFSSTKSAITHTHFGAQKTKDAVCDQFRSNTGERPSVDPETPAIRINVYVLNDEATISLDLSGSSLHQRGYRLDERLAPLKENLASAILKLLKWEKRAEERGALVDPMCGSGTLVIEAALMATKTAPGMLRKYFGFKRWKQHDGVLWDKLRDEADSKRITDPKLLPLMIGYDMDPKAIKAAWENAESAGVREFVHFEKRELEGIETPKNAKSGVFVVNPPYGERLGEEEYLKPLYRRIGDAMKKKFQGYQGGVFTGSPVLAKEVGLKASRRHVLFNGAIECRLLEYELYSGGKEKKAASALTEG